MPKPLLFLLHPGRACVSSRIRHFVTPWTEAHQALLPMEFSRQEYWSGLPFLTAGNLPDPGIEPVSFESPALAGGFFITCATSEAPCTQHREYSLQLHLAVLQMSSPRIAHTILSLLSMLSQVEHSKHISRFVLFVFDCYPHSKGLLYNVVILYGSFFLMMPSGLNKIYNTFCIIIKALKTPMIFGKNLLLMLISHLSCSPITTYSHQDSNLPSFYLLRIQEVFRQACQDCLQSEAVNRLRGRI